MAQRHCQNPECKKKLPAGSHGNTKYCANNDRCANRAGYLAKKAKETGDLIGRVSKEESVDGRASARRGGRYEAFVADGWAMRIARYETGASDGLSQAKVVEITGESQSNVARWYAAWLEDELTRKAQSEWSRDPEVEALLAPNAAAFAAWRTRYFTDERGNPFITPAVQQKWIRAILRAITLGRRQVILTPPRHGKTEMLIHFCIWLICREPNIRILWIGPNEIIAKQSGQSIIDQLENNERLVAEMLGPGGTWKPQSRSGKSWTASRAVVATRTRTGIKSPTFTCIGKGSGLLSRDADFIVADDIVDQDDAKSPTARDDLEGWFITQLSSRKQSYTGIAAIGSRQGHKELWGTLLDNPGWSSIVEHAHDPDCTLPIHYEIPVEEHDACPVCPPADPNSDDVAVCDHVKCEICAAHVDCMLIPELATMHFLQNQRTAAQSESYFEMVYQNITRPEGSDPVTDEHLDACRNRSRRIGDIPPEALKGLIAGHDPASAGIQGNVLWAFDRTTKKRYLVDLEAQKAGGTPGFRAILRDWFERYGCTLWIVETQNNNDAVMQDSDVVEYAAKNGITILPTYTTKYNKWSVEFGLPVQLELFKRRIATPGGGFVPAPLIDLPYGDEHSREKIRPYEKQVKNFEPGAKNNGDLLMAGWIPENHIRIWVYEQQTEVEFDHAGSFEHSSVASQYVPTADALDWHGNHEEPVMVGAA